MGSPRVAAVVLTKDGGEHLEAGLAALLAPPGPSGGLELILVDNGSVDGSVEAARKRFPELRMLRNETNVGFARGVNLGAAATRAEILILVNDDAIVEPEALEALVDAIESAPAETIAVAGMTTDATGERVDFVEGLLTFDGHAFQRGFGERIESVDIGRFGDPRLFPCGAFCALKRREFVELGGFDDAFFAYLEDVDFGWRATLSGRTTIFVPEARARHVSGATGKRLGLTTRGVLFETNAFFTAYKNLEDDSLAALLPAILATFQHRALQGVLSRQPDAAEALSDPFRGSPDVRALPRRSLRESVAGLVARVSGTGRSRASAPVSGPGRPLLIDDEVARMWLVAWNRIVSAWPSLAVKRREVQARRSVADRELFASYPLHLVPTYPGDEELFASEFFRQLLPAEPRLVSTTLRDVTSAPA